jgi:hypothetical protein
LFLGLFLAAALGLAAQTRFQAGLAFTPGIPQDDFHDQLGRTAWGGSLFFAYRPGGGPFAVGTNLGFMVYGYHSWDSWLDLAYSDYWIDERTTNSIITWTVFVRLQPTEGFLRPYIDLFAGLHILSTDTEIVDDEWYDSDGGFSDNIATDTAFSYGVGAGVMIPLLRMVRSDRGTRFSMDLEVGARFAKGGRAEYLVESDYPGEYNWRVSRTDLLVLTAGLAFSF